MKPRSGVWGTWLSSATLCATIATFHVAGVASADDHEALATEADATAEAPAKITALHQAALTGATLEELARLIAAAEHVDVALEDSALTPLHLAAYSGRRRVAKALLEAGASATAVTVAGETPLHLTAHNDAKDVAALLIDAGANLAATDAAGRTALHLAANRGAKALAALLINAGANLNAVDKASLTPLHHVSNRMFEEGKEGVAQQLIDAGADVRAQDDKGYTALHLAAHFHRHVLGRALLDAGADVNASANGTTPLHMAARQGAWGIADLLIRHGASLDPIGAPDVKGPLLAALEGCHDRVAALLVKAGADAAIRNENGETPLAIAKRKGLVDTEALLIERQLAAADGEPERALAALAPETWQRLTVRALDRDDPEAVLRLLRNVSPQDEELADVVAHLLYSAAADDSHRVAAALIEQGYEVDAGSSYTPLHAAAKYEALAAAELLIARGANVNANSDGWTPLHMALLFDTERPAFAMARTLVEHGADVNAKTTIIGWTPLHLAVLHASFGNAPALAVVQALLERGAEANVRTRLGGWTPVRAARQGDENEAVLEVLAAAGGEDGGYDQAPELPLYQNGRLEWAPRQSRGVDPAADVGASAAVKGRFNMTISTPVVHFFDQHAVQGAFTAPGAAERLLFENIGILDDYGPYTVAALQDRHGNVLPLLAYNHYTDFVGICRDPTTNTDTAMFEHGYDGTCCPWKDRVYLHYDAAAGTLLEVLHDEDLDLSTAAPNEQGICDWRRKKAALATYREATSALAVGKLPQLAKDGTTQVLPMRVIPSPVVDEQLAALRQLPEDVVEVWEVSGSSRWRVVGVEYHRRPEGSFNDPCEGVVLVWDATHEQWRSIYDCADLEATEIHDDMLATALNDENCLWRRLGELCYLEVDLATSAARLWDEPQGNFWVDSRQRPAMCSMNETE